ncbi:tape measure protein [Escherichia coli]|uniref:tape measure protein n=1 Tax=Escherichia coli TaxID=562 RepID=UPI000BDF1AC5|nr:tape measure protein [Escherichia coli]
MAKNLKASLIVDLLGNISAKSRQWSQELGAFFRSGRTGLGGLGNAARRAGQETELVGSRMQRTLAGVRGSIRTVTSDFDRLQGSITGTIGRISNLYGMLAGGAAVYGFNKAFIRPAAEMENYILRLNAINHGDTAKTEAVKAWAVQNAKDTTWGLAGVMQEYASSRGFGMSDREARRFITMLQDQGGYHGWSLSDAQGASLQLKQMFARQSIQAADANILTGYGINVYQLLADKLGVNQKIIREKGEKGKLGPDSIRLLFQVMAEQAKGAQKNAMNSWTGMTSMMGDVWDGFAREVMAKGPFDSLKKSLKGFLDYTDAAQKSGLQDKLATQTASALNQGFEYARDAATGFYRAIQKVRETLQALRDAGYGDALDRIGQGAQTAAKYLMYMYLASRALKVLRFAGTGALRLGATPLRYGMAMTSVLTSPFRKPQTTVPGTQPGRAGRFLNFLTGVNPAAVQPVLVTNWPAGGLASGGGDVVVSGDGKTVRGRKKRGPGRGRGVTTVVTAGGLLTAAGNRMGLGRFAGLFRGAGRLGGGALWAGAMAAPVLLDSSASAADKAGAVGSLAGSIAGGALGAAAGPVGVAIGSTVGSYLGDYLGGWLTQAWQKLRGGSDENGGQATAKTAARVELVAPEGWRARSIDVDDTAQHGLDVNVWNGGNYGLY